MDIFQRVFLISSIHVTGIAQSLDLKMIPDAPPNPTDVAESIEKVKNNDEKLKHLNLNNIKVTNNAVYCSNSMYFVKGGASP